MISSPAATDSLVQIDVFNDDLPIVQVGDISDHYVAHEPTHIDSVLDAKGFPRVAAGITLEAPCELDDATERELQALVLTESMKDAVVRFARARGITLSEARLIIAAEQQARFKDNTYDINITEMTEVIGEMRVSARRVKVIKKRMTARASKKAAAKKKVEKLSDRARRAKWEAFENSDRDDFINAAVAQGYVAALVTFKVPNVTNWIEYVPNPQVLNSKEGALQKMLRTLGSKYKVEGYDKKFRGVWVQETSQYGIARPHIHSVMMLPYAESTREFIVRKWAKLLNIPAEFANACIHIRYGDIHDKRSQNDQFTHAMRYLSQDKSEQECVPVEWLEAGHDVGHLWDVRGFEPLPEVRVALTRESDDIVNEVMAEGFTTRPRVSVDEVTGEVTMNAYPRFEKGSALGNVEVMESTEDFVARLISEGVLSPASNNSSSN